MRGIINKRKKYKFTLVKFNNPSLKNCDSDDAQQKLKYKPNQIKVEYHPQITLVFNEHE